MPTAYTVRAIRAHEWREARALETHAEATVRPDEFWQERTARSSSDAGPDASARQFVAIAEDGGWVGTVVALVERVGDEDYSGTVVAETGGHLAAVYLSPGHRGRGVMEALFEAALTWLRELGMQRARLHIHEDNARAERFYDRVGFRLTGDGFAGPNGREREMVLPL